MASIKFLIQSKSDICNIYVRLIDGRNLDIKAKTNILINFNDWDSNKKYLKHTRNENLKNIDFELNNLKNNLTKHYNNSNEIKNINWLKSFINPNLDNKITDYLIDYFDYYIENKKLELNFSTIKKINVLKNKLIKFERSLNVSFLIKDFDSKFQDKFIRWSRQLNYADNTTSKSISQIKMILRHAKTIGKELALNFEGVKLQQKKVKNIYLNFAEIEKIENTKLIDINLVIAKDWLIISCFCAQRFSDFMRFDVKMIREQNNVRLIEFVQQKTNTIMTIPLHKKIIEILEKRNWQFPDKQLSQKYNRYVKKLCGIAKIDNLVYGGISIKTENGIRKVHDNYKKYQLVSSHIGRRSFASNFYGTIPTALLMSMTGHTTEKMFLVYIGKSNSDKAIELSSYF